MSKRTYEDFKTMFLISLCPNLGHIDLRFIWYKNLVNILNTLGTLWVCTNPRQPNQNFKLCFGRVHFGATISHHEWSRFQHEIDDCSITLSGTNNEIHNILSAITSRIT